MMRGDCPHHLKMRLGDWLHNLLILLLALAPLGEHQSKLIQIKTKDQLCHHHHHYHHYRQYHHHHHCHHHHHHHHHHLLSIINIIPTTDQN